MRWKYDADNPQSDMYRCCFCCHVRTGTIMLGIFQMFLHMVLVSMFALACLHPELMDSTVQGQFQTCSVEISRSHISSNETWETLQPQLWHRRTMNSEDRFMWFLLAIGSFGITLMLLYGAVKGRAGYLIPFFCVQVFDFCLTCLTVVGYFSYIPDIKRWIMMQKVLPFCDQLLRMDSDWLMLFAILFFVLMITIKAYLIGVVWACYKYLNTHQMVSVSRGSARTYQSLPEDTEMWLPPKYEDVIRLPPPGNDEAPPPPYTAQ